MCAVGDEGERARAVILSSRACMCMYGVFCIKVSVSRRGRGGGEVLVLRVAARLRGGGAGNIFVGDWYWRFELS
jgi:hypothetical protein